VDVIESVVSSERTVLICLVSLRKNLFHTSTRDLRLQPETENCSFYPQSSAERLIRIAPPVCSIASIHAKSNEFFETLSSRMAASRNSVLVRNFGWLFRRNGSSQSRNRCRSSSAFRSMYHHTVTGPGGPFSYTHRPKMCIPSNRIEKCSIKK
jgi:hypothetical protein